MKKINSWEKIKLITLGIWVLLSLGIQVWESFPQWRNLPNDFFSYYIGSTLFWDNKSPYLSNDNFTVIANYFKLNFLVGSGYSYPPFLAFIFYPFILIEPYLAARIWQIINCFIYGIFMHIVLTKNKNLPLKLYLFLAVALVTFLPVIHTIAMGQINIIILICLSAYFFNTNGYIKALGLTIASLIKVYPLLFILKDFIHKQFSFIGKFIILISSFVLLFVAISKLDLLLYYFSVFLPKINNSLDTYYSNQSLNGIISRLLMIDSNNFLLSQADFSHIMLLIASLCISGLIFLSIKFSKKKELLGLLWLGVITLLAGKNSFWNFTPCIFLIIYLIQTFTSLSKTQKFLFCFSLFLSNFLWLITDIYNNTSFIPQTNSLVIYNGINAIGFIYLSIQVGLLFSLLLNKKIENKIEVSR